MKGKETIKKMRIINAYIFFIPVASLRMVWNIDNALIIDLEGKEEFLSLLIHLDAVFVSRRMTLSPEVSGKEPPWLRHMARRLNIKYLIRFTPGNIKIIGNTVGGQGEKWYGLRLTSQFHRGSAGRYPPSM
jgi:hypothetical protein